MSQTLNHEILVTGGSGFIGSNLIPVLEKQGKKVAILGREKVNLLPSFLWDIAKKEIDPAALASPHTIIHLAGAGIADKRWTFAYKKKIGESRVESAGLLFESLKKYPNRVTTLIAASAIGYYGASGDVWVEEDFKAPDDFLGETCREWEKSSLQFEKLGIRVVIFRIGIVLSKTHGALPKLAFPVKIFSGAPIGSGNQYMSWIHIHDLCRMFAFAAVSEKLHGIYNAVAPGPVTNKKFIQQIAAVLHRPVWPVRIPAAVIRLTLGEKSSIILEGQRVSSEKIRMTGFEFKHLDLQKTLQELLLK